MGAGSFGGLALWVNADRFKWEKGAKGTAHLDLGGGILAKTNRETKEVDIIEYEGLQGRLDKDYWILIKKKESTKDFDWMIPIGNPFDIYQLVSQ